MSDKERQVEFVVVECPLSWCDWRGSIEKPDDINMESTDVLGEHLNEDHSAKDRDVLLLEAEKGLPEWFENRIE